MNIFFLFLSYFLPPSFWPVYFVYTCGWMVTVVKRCISLLTTLVDGHLTDFIHVNSMADHMTTKRCWGAKIQELAVERKRQNKTDISSCIVSVQTNRWGSNQGNCGFNQFYHIHGYISSTNFDDCLTDNDHWDYPWIRTFCYYELLTQIQSL